MRFRSRSTSSKIDRCPLKREIAMETSNVEMHGAVAVSILGEAKTGLLAKVFSRPPERFHLVSIVLLL